MILRPAELRAANLLRVAEFGHGFIAEWTHGQWAVATCAEIGEMLNEIKKTWRADGDRKKVAREAADVMIYGDIWAARWGVPTLDSGCDVFNDECDATAPVALQIKHVGKLWREADWLLDLSLNASSQSTMDQLRFRTFRRAFEDVTYVNGVQLASAIIETFNAKSDQIGSSVKLVGGGL